jgi:hypothetical protein
VYTFSHAVGASIGVASPVSAISPVAAAVRVYVTRAVVSIAPEWDDEDGPDLGICEDCDQKSYREL